MHGINEPQQRKHACTHCRNQKIRCEGGHPCRECFRRGRKCSLSGQNEVQPADSTDTGPRISWQRTGSPQLPTNRSAKESHYLNLYWELFHPHWSFIHRSSFSDYETPLLVQSMVVLGLWVSQEPNTEAKAIELHKLLGSAIRDQTVGAQFLFIKNLVLIMEQDVWDASKSEQACNTCAWPIPTYQAMLLHIIFAGLVKSCGVLGLDLKPRLSPDDSNLLTRLVTSCKKMGMLYYPNMLSRCSHSDIGTFNWVSVEEVKHFNLALFKVCRTFSKSLKDRSGINSLNTGGSTSLCVEPRDLEFPLPTDLQLWNAKGKEEWLAVGAEKMEGPGLNDALESEWISNSARVLEGIGI
ncbi:Zn(II)2Cys6 transcription factor [Aspergillus puulaauensis]|uniref:Zn(2)-C6 fungal-type domain-containing protein n=1 Tax=Aspergillus puulaauensis TaxID=1220207 RepID=A0A7R7XZP7_9EURO|nr:uncharacterized protein APUU_80969A [Aspergillus puulaauensis]BCS30666.1 hypothetical protein APUU_80969A [Aspergillus puulaauensis]